MPRIQNMFKNIASKLKRKKQNQTKSPAVTTKQSTTQIAITSHSDDSAVSEEFKPKSLQVSVYADTSSNTIIRINVPEVNHERICSYLLTTGELLANIKKIYLFHNLNKPVQLKYDENNKAYWDIILHTQKEETQTAIIAMLDNKKELFNLTTKSIEQILPLPNLNIEKKTNSQPEKPKTPEQKQTQSANNESPSQPQHNKEPHNNNNSKEEKIKKNEATNVEIKTGSSTKTTVDPTPVTAKPQTPVPADKIAPPSVATSIKTEPVKEVTPTTAIDKAPKEIKQKEDDKLTADATAKITKDVPATATPSPAPVTAKEVEVKPHPVTAPLKTEQGVDKTELDLKQDTTKAAIAPALVTAKPDNAKPETPVTDVVATVKTELAKEAIPASIVVSDIVATTEKPTEAADTKQKESDKLPADTTAKIAKDIPTTTPSPAPVATQKVEEKLHPVAAPLKTEQGIDKTEPTTKPEVKTEAPTKPELDLQQNTTKSTTAPTLAAAKSDNARPVTPVADVVAVKTEPTKAVTPAATVVSAIAATTAKLTEPTDTKLEESDKLPADTTAKVAIDIPTTPSPVSVAAAEVKEKLHSVTAAAKTEQGVDKPEPATKLEVKTETPSKPELDLKQDTTKAATTPLPVAVKPNNAKPETPVTDVIAAIKAEPAKEKTHGSTVVSNIAVTTEKSTEPTDTKQKAPDKLPADTTVKIANDIPTTTPSPDPVAAKDVEAKPHPITADAKTEQDSDKPITATKPEVKAEAPAKTEADKSSTNTMAEIAKDIPATASPSPIPLAEHTVAATPLPITKSTAPLETTTATLTTQDNTANTAVNTETTPQSVSQAEANNTPLVKPEEQTTTAAVSPPIIKETKEQIQLKERQEKMELIRKKYIEYTEQIKKLFPDGTVVVTNNEKEDEIQLAFGKNEKLCEIVRINLIDYKHPRKNDVGNNFTLPRSNRITDLLKDDRQAIWLEAFKITTPTLAKKAEKSHYKIKTAPIITKRHKNIEIPEEKASITAQAGTTKPVSTEKLHLRIKPIITSTNSPHSPEKGDNSLANTSTSNGPKM